jgi:hypothetical protein
LFGPVNFLSFSFEVVDKPRQLEIFGKRETAPADTTPEPIGGRIEAAE